MNSTFTFLISDRYWKLTFVLLIFNFLAVINEDFRADLGFVPRVDVLKLGNAATRKFYPVKSALSNHHVQWRFVPLPDLYLV